MLIKYYRRFFEVSNRFTDKVITVRIILFLMLIGITIGLAVELYKEMVRKQIISL